MIGGAAARRRGARLLCWLVWLGGSSAAAQDPARETIIQDALERQLSLGAYPFCREPSHVWSARERAACEFAPAAQERCPAFAAACAGAAPVERREPGWQWLAWLVKSLGWLIFSALAALAVALPVWLGLRLWRSRRPTRAAVELAGPELEPISEEPPSFERAVEVHIERARRLADAGNFAEAVAEVQLGVVLSLDSRGLIAARRGRTNGDYARELRSQPELAAVFGELTRATEAVQFGGRRLDGAGFRHLLERAAPLLAGLALALALSTSACQPAASRVAGPRCGGGPDEYGLLCEVLAPSGAMQPRYRPLRGAHAVSDDVAAIVVLPNEMDAEAWATLKDWVEAGGVVVLTGDSPLDDDFGVERAGLCGAQARALVAGDPALISPGPTLVAPLLSPGALCDKGEKYIAYAFAEHSDGRFVFLPTPELLSNASLVAGQNARVLAELLDLPEGRVEIVGTWTRQVSSNPLAALTAAGLGPWLAQLLLLALAFAAYRGVPFGRRVEPAANRRRRFSEHVQALGQRWAEQRAARSALAAYGAFASDLLRERVPGASLGGDLARAVAEKTGRPEAVVSRTLELTRRAQAGHSAGSEDEHLQALRELARLVEDVGGPR